MNSYTVFKELMQTMSQICCVCFYWNEVSAKGLRLYFKVFTFCIKNKQTNEKTSKCLTHPYKMPALGLGKTEGMFHPWYGCLSVARRQWLPRQMSAQVDSCHLFTKHNACAYMMLGNPTGASPQVTLSIFIILWICIEYHISSVQ